MRVAADTRVAGVVERGPGRPRAEGHDEKILDAVVALIDAGRPVTVAAVVADSGVSRAALYRRWPSMTELVSTALDRGRAAIEIDLSEYASVREAMFRVLFGNPKRLGGEGYSDRRFRARIALAMQDRDLQHAYWSSHVSRRRGAMHAALAEGIRTGELRSDLDIESSIDLITGVYYYQLVARGVQVDDPGVMDRCRAAFETAWRGMAAR
ncbi:TetR/AcrR family transcriptional regulator [Microbacterium halophytorum]|uniref:TetR/AcrR family transcriptional regulator n=1 Tax=Microbacterium halophytorum TaxID=2067568 RepID=UPI000CFE0106|nr:TetR/AcrR family transcriptional regulator [Microbacterium halophytorum]